MAGQGGKLWQVGMYNNDDMYVFQKKGNSWSVFFSYLIIFGKVLKPSS